MRLFYVAFGSDRWSWQPMMWIDRDPHHGRRRGPRDRPVRHEADAGLLLGRAHRLPADRRARRAERRDLADGELTSLQAVLFYLSPTASRRSAPSPWSRSSATPAARRRQLSRWAGLGGSRRSWRASSRSSCSHGRHPADRRLHRQVGGLRGRAVGRRLAGRDRRGAEQRRRGVLLRAGHRADVLRRARRRRPVRSRSPSC